MKKKEIFKIILSWIPALTVMVMIFCFSAQFSEDSAQTSAGILEWIEKTFNITINHEVLSKIAHACEFCALGAMVSVGFLNTLKRPAPVASLLFSVVYALSDEIHQIFVPGRACRAFDIFVDTCGAGVGIIAFMILFYIIGKIKSRKNKTE